MRRWLLLWSGGLDSTYWLAHRLRETNDEIHAHHIHIINHEGRAKAESESCKALLPKLQAIRPFTWSQSVVDHTGHGAIPYDMQIVCFEAGIVARAAAHAHGKPVFTHWTIGTHEAEGHDWKRWVEIYPAFKAAAYPLKDPPEFELGLLRSKHSEMGYLKTLGLLDDCWYCRTPKDGKPCGLCKTCDEVRQAI